MKPTPLCRTHYNIIYKLHCPQQHNCTTCNASLKTVKPRTCPNPEKIERLLKDRTEYEQKINVTDKICPACYKLHLRLLEEDKVTSSDENLVSCLNTLSGLLPTMEQIKTEADVSNYAIIRTIIDIGNKLLQREPVLLSTAHDIYMDYTKQASTHIISSDADKATAKWVLAQLHDHLSHHMMFTCKIRKYGTLIYRPDTDMLAVATQALWKLKNVKKKHLHDLTDEDDTDSYEQSHYETVLNDLNDRVHMTAKRYIDNDTHVPFDYSEMNISHLIENTDEKLWNAIMHITKSIAEREGRSKVSELSSDSSKVKKVRCFFILSAILFCADSRCSMPMHTLLADVIQSQGGSHTLVQILNRIGVCSSFDVLQRYIHFTVSQPPIHENEGDTLEIISVDNIDFLHSYARVFKENRQSSWHGTTIQKVKPLPSLEYARGREENDMEINIPVHVRKRSERPSPMPSPHKDLGSPIYKKQRIDRTGVEKHLSLAATDIATMVAKYNTHVACKTQHPCH